MYLNLLEIEGLFGLLMKKHTRDCESFATFGPFHF